MHLLSNADVCFVFGDGSLRFKSRADQIGCNIANLLATAAQCSVIGAVLPEGAMTQRWASQTRYTIRRNTVSII